MIEIPEPMLAAERPVAPFSADDWIFELKYDGYRCLAGIERGEVQLVTRNGTDCTAWFPEIEQALSALPDGPHIIDGEACVLRPDGTSDFNLLQERARSRRWYPGAPPVTFAVFDILVHRGRKVMGWALERRKAALAKLLSEPRPGVLFVQDLPADALLFQKMIRPKDKGGYGLQIEGVVAKRRGSAYKPGVRTQDWLKVKRPGWNEGRNWKG